MENQVMKLEGSITTTTNPYQSLIDMVLNTVSLRTQRDYARALNDFMAWYTATGQSGLNKATVAGHMQALKDRGVPDSSINQRLAAIRKLCNEAADNDFIPEAVAQGIQRVKYIKVQGKKLGNWLTQAQASTMLQTPDTGTLKGKRDRAILAIMLGCGLRREEVTSLMVSHVQQREDRWVILDLQGKHNRTRTVPMAGWVYEAIESWLVAAGIETGVIFHRIRKDGVLFEQGLTPCGIWSIVQEYSPIPHLAPHDLRRTFAKLAVKGGADLIQISMSLGHASVKTTEIYLGSQIDLANAPSDYIKL